jgi:translation initiation factor 1
VTSPSKPPSKLSRASPAIPRDGVVRLFRDRGGRNGKTVTVIHGLPERGPALEARLSELKRMCGAGGTLRDGVIQIQGDHRDRLAERFRALGYPVKLAGG